MRQDDDETWPELRAADTFKPNQSSKFTDCRRETDSPHHLFIHRKPNLKPDLAHYSQNLTEYKKRVKRQTSNYPPPA